MTTCGNCGLYLSSQWQCLADGHENLSLDDHENMPDCAWTVSATQFRGRCDGSMCGGECSSNCKCLRPVMSDADIVEYTNDGILVIPRPAYPVAL